MTDLAKAVLRSKRGDNSAAGKGKSGKAPKSGGKGTLAAKDPIVPGELTCHFNPSSLRLTYSNQFGEGKPFAHARETVAKLDVELIFDNTGIGYSVLDELAILTAMTRSRGGAAAGSAKNDKPPAGEVAVVEFHWAGKLFEGVVESMTQTIEYWSREGIPMRATVQLSLKETSEADYSKFRYAHTEPVKVPQEFVPSVPAGNGDKASTDAASKGGNPRAGSAIAAFNGLESMRGGVGGSAGASAGGSIGVSAGANLGAAAGFAASGGISAGAGAGASLGFGLGASAGASAGAGLGAAAGIGMAGGVGIGGGIGGGIGAGAGVGAGIGIGAGVSAGAFAGAGVSAGISFGASASASAGASASFGASVSAGASASAGLSASQGAFAGLGGSKRITGSTGIDPARLMPPIPPMPIGPGARFDSTGRLLGDGSGVVAAGYVRIG